MKHYNYILMDLDGTLTDPFIGITKSVQYALKHYGIIVDDLTHLAPFIGPPLADSFQEFYHFPKNQAEEAVWVYHERFVEKGWLENKVYEGMEEFLRTQKELGKELFVATSKPEPLAVKILEYFKLLPYFTFIGGDTMDHTRSSKDKVIRYILEQGLIDDKGYAVMIGDRKYDIMGAQKNGIDSIGVLYGYGNRVEFEKAGADYIVSDISELSELLGK
jgi:phosphoglycolate phosphatase